MQKDDIPDLPHIICLQEFQAGSQAHMFTHGPVAGEDVVVIIGFDEDVVETIEFIGDAGCIGNEKDGTGEGMADKKAQGGNAMGNRKWDDFEFTDPDHGVRLDGMHPMA